MRTIAKLAMAAIVGATLLVHAPLAQVAFADDLGGLSERQAGLGQDESSQDKGSDDTGAPTSQGEEPDNSNSSTTGQGEEAGDDAREGESPSTDSTGEKGNSAATRDSQSLGTRGGPTPAGNGTAYAVYDPTTRTLTFLRSHDTYADGPGQTVTDISGNTHTGTVYGGVETVQPASIDDVPWHEVTTASNGVRSVRVADGCTVAPTSCAWWFCDDTSLKNVDLEGLDTSSCMSFAHMFDGCYNLEALDVTPLNTLSATSMAYMFNGCRYVRALDLSGFDVSNVSDMSHMFCQCEHIPSLDLSGWDTAGVTDMSYLFSLCKAMTSVDLTGWNTGGVTNMSCLFGGCNALAHVPAEALNTSSCTSMESMFGGCWAATSLDVSGFETSKVTDMSNMFTSCQALTTLDLSSFDTTSVTDLTYMFQICDALQSLDLSSFDTSAATTAEEMFAGCNALREVKLGEAFVFAPGDTTHNYLPSPTAGDTYTGNWANRDDESQSHKSVWLAANYDGTTMAGTWVWEEWHPFPLTFELGGGNAPEGQTYPSEYQMGETLPLPGTDASALGEPVWSGYTFICWRDETGAQVTQISGESRGSRTITAEWNAPQIRVQVPVAATLTGNQEPDGTLSLASQDGDFVLCLLNESSLPVVATAKATPSDGFRIKDVDDGLGDLEADVWLTPTTTGIDPTAQGYDPTTDAGYTEHSEVRLSQLGSGAQVGPTIPSGSRVWLNKLAGRMGGWSTNTGTKERLLTINWTFSIAS